jgi:alpha-L-fucosidase
MPQPPQLLGSDCVSVQPVVQVPAAVQSVHSASPGGQIPPSGIMGVQKPSSQLRPGGQKKPQLPQLLGSVSVLVQTPLQSVSPGGQLMPHVPPEQV